MELTFAYDTPPDDEDYRYIPAGIKVKMIDEWNGFVTVEYQGGIYYFNRECFVELKSKSVVTV